MCVNQDKYLVRWGSRTEIIRANRANKTEKNCANVLCLSKTTPQGSFVFHAGG